MSGTSLHLDQPVRLAAAVELLNAEGVADVVLAQAVAGALREAHAERRVRQSDQLLQVGVALQQDVVDVGLALALAADRVAEELHRVAAGHVEPLIGQACCATRTSPR